MRLLFLLPLLAPTAALSQSVEACAAQVRMLYPDAVRAVSLTSDGFCAIRGPLRDGFLGPESVEAARWRLTPQPELGPRVGDFVSGALEFDVTGYTGGVAFRGARLDVEGAVTLDTALGTLVLSAPAFRHEQGPQTLSGALDFTLSARDPDRFTEIDLVSFALELDFDGDCSLHALGLNALAGADLFDGNWPWGLLDLLPDGAMDAVSKEALARLLEPPPEDEMALCPPHLMIWQEGAPLDLTGALSQGFSLDPVRWAEALEGVTLTARIVD